MEVCFGAKGNDYGELLFPRGGVVTAFLLEHVRGKVNCAVSSGSLTDSNWGCGHHSGLGLNRLTVFITDSANQIIVPHNPAWYNSEGIWYTLSGFNSNSPYVVMDTGSVYNMVKGEQMRVWYGESLKSMGDGDNAGRVCVNVYALFMSKR